jgi:hypothetical protein
VAGFDTRHDSVYQHGCITDIPTQVPPSSNDPGPIAKWRKVARKCNFTPTCTKAAEFHSTWLAWAPKICQSDKLLTGGCGLLYDVLFYLKWWVDVVGDDEGAKVAWASAVEMLDDMFVNEELLPARVDGDEPATKRSRTV